MGAFLPLSPLAGGDLLPLVVDEELVRLEVGLVVHCGDFVDSVAEIEMLDIMLPAVFGEVQDIEGAEAAAGKGWIEEKINRVQPAAAAVHYRHPDQPVLEEVADLVGFGNVIGKETEVVFFGTVVFVWKAAF